MDLEKIDFRLKKILKITTILIFLISICIYEIGICNGDFIAKIQNLYNFSLCRIILYIVFFILLFKNIDKFINNAVDTLKSKQKKIIIGIYIPVMLFTIMYVLIRWSSIYKALTFIITVLMGLLFIIYVSSNYIKNVIVIVCTVGFVFTFATDFNHAIDEKKHIMTSLNIANGNLNYVENPLSEPAYNNIIFNCDIDQFIKFYSKKYEPNLNNEWNRNEETEIYYICSSPADYNFIMYMPSAIGITFARFLGGSIADVYIIGRLFNLIAYSAMVIIILKLLPYKQKIFFIIYMLPFQLLLASSYSVDGICLCLLGIFIAYCLKLSEIDYKTIKLKQILTLMILYALCLVSKNLAYCAIGLFIFVLPIFKILKNNKKNIPVLSTILVISMIVCAMLLLNRFNKTAEQGGDPRGGETGVTGQIEFLISSPTNIIKVGYEHIMNSLLNYNWYTYLNHAKFFGDYSNQVFFLELIFIIYVCITDKDKKINKRTAIVSIITFVSVFLSTSFMLYLTFTPIGEINITGYQPRYITPILPMLLMLISSNKIKENKQLKEEQNQIEEPIYLISGLFIIIDLVSLIYVI